MPVLRTTIRARRHRQLRSVRRPGCERPRCARCPRLSQGCGRTARHQRRRTRGSTPEIARLRSRRFDSLCLRQWWQWRSRRRKSAASDRRRIRCRLPERVAGCLRTRARTAVGRHCVLSRIGQRLIRFLRSLRQRRHCRLRDAHRTRIAAGRPAEGPVLEGPRHRWQAPGPPDPAPRFGN